MRGSREIRFCIETKTKRQTATGIETKARESETGIETKTGDDAPDMWCRPPCAVCPNAADVAAAPLQYDIL